jgi:hypothetical protein
VDEINMKPLLLCRIGFRGILFIGLGAWLALSVPHAIAHTSGSSFLSLKEQPNNRFIAQVDFDLRDLNQQLDMDANYDGALSWGEIRKSQSAIEALVASRTLFTSNALCISADYAPLSIAEHGTGPYARLTFALLCASSIIEVNHAAWFALDPGHRALLEYTDIDGQRTQTLISKQSPTWRAQESLALRVQRFLFEGVLHLVTGYDHLAFLLVLLLALMRRQSTVPLPLQQTMRKSLVIVTAFTVAHSLTLVLAATGYVVLPSRPIEIIIAISVGIAALLNLWRGSASHGWKLAFVFGLVHGFGFAGALAELASDIDLLALAAFNIGIELGQLAIALLVAPLMWVAFRDSRRERVGVPAVSIAIAGLAGYWAISRFVET